MLYQIINPSDTITFEAESRRVAQVITLCLGRGQAGLRDEQGEPVLNVTLGLDAAQATAILGASIDQVLNEASA